MATRILTVDDSKTIRMIVKKAFNPYDCELFEAENGVEGLAVAAKEKPDLIILDITMPVMSGMEMLDRLISEADLKDIPVIMLTAESGKDNVMKIVKMGVKDYMVKPFKGQELIERVVKILKLEPNVVDADGESKTSKYFIKTEDVQVLKLPPKVTRPVSLEVESELQTKLKEMNGPKLNKMILDLCKTGETNVSLIKLIIYTLKRCRKHAVKVKVVATEKQAEEFKGFQETSAIPIVNSIDEARAAF
jgi:DNA-binding response OmpR family regulator